MGMIVGLLIISMTPRSCSKACNLVLGICFAWVGQGAKGVGCFRNGDLNIQYGRSQQVTVFKVIMTNFW